MIYNDSIEGSPQISTFQFAQAPLLNSEIISAMHPLSFLTYLLLNKHYIFIVAEIFKAPTSEVCAS